MYTPTPTAHTPPPTPHQHHSASSAPPRRWGGTRPPRPTGTSTAPPGTPLAYMSASCLSRCLVSCSANRMGIWLFISLYVYLYMCGCVGLPRFSISCSANRMGVRFHPPPQSPPMHNHPQAAVPHLRDGGRRRHRHLRALVPQCMYMYGYISCAHT